MDHMRRDEIGAEIEGYQHKIRIGFSSVTVGDVVQLISEVERLQKERDQLGAGGKVWQRTAGHLKQERDAALAEVERLKGAYGHEEKKQAWMIGRGGVVNDD